MARKFKPKTPADKVEAKFPDNKFPPKAAKTAKKVTVKPKMPKKGCA